MPNFSKKSLAELNSCHPDLQRLFNEVIKTRDCIILEGHRGKEAQEKAFNEGHSKKHYPDGNHNKIPSLAVDVMPYPLDWKDTTGIKDFALFVMATAEKLGIHITWGGDWKTLVDMPHYELKAKTLTKEHL